MSSRSRTWLGLVLVGLALAAAAVSSLLWWKTGEDLVRDSRVRDALTGDLRLSVRAVAAEIPSALPWILVAQLENRSEDSVYVDELRWETGGLRLFVSDDGATWRQVTDVFSESARQPDRVAVPPGGSLREFQFLPNSGHGQEVRYEYVLDDEGTVRSEPIRVRSRTVTGIPEASEITHLVARLRDRSTGDRVSTLLRLAEAGEALGKAYGTAVRELATRSDEAEGTRLLALLVLELSASLDARRTANTLMQGEFSDDPSMALALSRITLGIAGRPEWLR
jgi:hypothetical protein